MAEELPYNESQIRPLTGLEAIRLRPHMFFGPDSINQMVLDAITISIDAALRGTCNKIAVTLKPNEVILVENNSEGLPVEINKYENRSSLELLFTTLATPGYFHHFETPTVAAGYHQGDPIIVNAASEWLTVKNKRDGYIWSQSYERGTPKVTVTRGRKTEQTGLTITFKPDLSIFPPSTPPLDVSLIRNRCQEIAYTIAGCSVTFRDERTSEVIEQTFYAPSGLRALIENQSTPMHDIIHASIKKPMGKRIWGRGDLLIEFAVAYTDNSLNSELGYCNTVQTTHGGKHMTALRAGLVSALNRHLPPNTTYLTYKALPAGLITAISIQYPNPYFESFNQIKLMNSEVYSPIKSAVMRAVASFAAAHPDQMHRIIDHCITNRTRR